MDYFPRIQTKIDYRGPFELIEAQEKAFSSEVRNSIETVIAETLRNSGFPTWRTEQTPEERLKPHLSIRSFRDLYLGSVLVYFDDLVGRPAMIKISHHELNYFLISLFMWELPDEPKVKMSAEFTYGQISGGITMALKRVRECTFIYTSDGTGAYQAGRKTSSFNSPKSN